MSNFSGAFRYTWRSLIREVLLIALVVVFAAPFYLLFATSLKTSFQANSSPLSFPIRHPVWHNFVTAWTMGGATSGMGRAFLNSAIITVASVVLLVAVATSVSYVIARRTSKLSNALYVMFVLGVIIPSTLGLVPIYIAFRHLGLLATYPGMVLLYMGGALPFAVFLITGFIRALPTEFEEAAQMDGAGTMRTLLRVVVPLLRPILITVAMLAGLTVWNDFFLSLIFIGGSPIATLPLQLSLLANQNVAQWNIIFAAATICILPVLLLFIVAQRHFIRGFAGGIRG